MTDNRMTGAAGRGAARFGKRTALLLCILLVLIPLTLYLFWRGGNRRYYLVSVLILGYTMLPFFVVFERRRPQARELVVIAVLCALAVASRAAFVWAQHFKPLVGIVIIAGAALGPEAGFLVGAMSALVSDFLFGMGPWMPWQMFAFGAAGFLAGILVFKGVLSKKPLPLAVFGFFTVLLLVGPILDTCALFTMSSSVNAASAGAVYLSGLPVNLTHGAAVFLTVLLVSRPMFDKLDRIRVKYGMLEDG